MSTLLQNMYASSPTHFFIFMSMMLLCCVAVAAIFLKILPFLSKIRIKKGDAEISADGGQQIMSIEKPTLSEENVITMVLELQNGYSSYIDRIRLIKRDTLETQVKKFRNELTSFRNTIKDAYTEHISKCKDIDNKTDTVALYALWVDGIFDEILESAKIVLERNGFSEKSPDDMSDIVNQMFDSSFQNLLYEYENPPSYIKENEFLVESAKANKSKFFNSIDASMSSAKKLSEQMHKDIDDENNKFIAERTGAIKRNCPNLDTEKIIAELK